MVLVASNAASVNVDTSFSGPVITTHSVGAGEMNADTTGMSGGR